MTISMDTPFVHASFGRRCTEECPRLPVSHRACSCVARDAGNRRRHAQPAVSSGGTAEHGAGAEPKPPPKVPHTRLVPLVLVPPLPPALLVPPTLALPPAPPTVGSAPVAPAVPLPPSTLFLVVLAHETKTISSSQATGTHKIGRLHGRTLAEEAGEAKA